MSLDTIILAWRDANYFANLTPEQKASLPSNPAGEMLRVETRDNDFNWSATCTSENCTVFDTCNPTYG